MKYSFILFDADNTLLDFDRSEKSAFFDTFESYNITATPEMYSRYNKINDEMWKALEKGQIKKDEIGKARYKKFLSEFNLPLDPSEVNEKYLSNLQGKHFVIPGALEILSTLSKTHELYIVTNGIYKVQKKRLSNSGIMQYIKDYFVSEKIGHAKPSKQYFDYVEKNIAGFTKDRAIVIGDSLTSDIKGANNANIKSCWYNPKGTENKTDAVPDYEISSLNQLFDIL